MLNERELRGENSRKWMDLHYLLPDAPPSEATIVKIRDDRYDDDVKTTWSRPWSTKEIALFDIF